MLADARQRNRTHGASKAAAHLRAPAYYRLASTTIGNATTVIDSTSPRGGWLTDSEMVGEAVKEAHAQSWPQKTVKLILPLQAGSATDVTARLYGERLSERWAARS